jgi:hypothetical protein
LGGDIPKKQFPVSSKDCQRLVVGGNSRGHALPPRLIRKAYALKNGTSLRISYFGVTVVMTNR